MCVKIWSCIIACDLFLCKTAQTSENGRLVKKQLGEFGFFWLGTRYILIKKEVHKGLLPLGGCFDLGKKTPRSVKNGPPCAEPVVIKVLSFLLYSAKAAPVSKQLLCY